MRIVAENLVIERSGQVIIRGTSLAAAAGEALVITGANGAGKTTLLRALAALLPVTSGTIKVEQGELEKSVAEQCHAIGHANAVKAHLTVTENVGFWAQYLADDVARGDGLAAERTRSALAALDLEDLCDYPASYLSAGQKRRVGLARLLAAPRPIWLLDEPTASLDKRSSERLAQVMTAHTRSGGIIIAATHLPLGIAGVRELHLVRGGAAA